MYHSKDHATYMDRHYTSLNKEQRFDLFDLFQFCLLYAPDVTLWETKIILHHLCTDSSYSWCRGDN